MSRTFVYDTVQTSIVSPNFESYPSNLVKYTSTTRFRYDALGRRVWVRLERDTLCTRDASPEFQTGCASTLTRTLWDGDQLFAEFQTDGRTGADPATLESDGTGGAYYGTVLYVHGLGLDAPLAVYKGEQVLPVAAYHGQFDRAVCGLALCPSEQLAFPERHTFGPVRSNTPSWYGSLLSNGLDPSGYVYLRNRYPDPRTGRFTQEDPIGFAGGMNLWLCRRRPSEQSRSVWPRIRGSGYATRADEEERLRVRRKSNA